MFGTWPQILNDILQACNNTIATPPYDSQEL